MAIWIYLFGSLGLVGVSLFLPTTFGLPALLLGCCGLGFCLGLLLHDWVFRPLN